jgi:hypothetical protein
MTLNIQSAPAETSAPDRVTFNSWAPDERLNSRQVAAALTAIGLPTSSATLNTKACRGDGPPYQLYGRIRVYTWGRVVAWVNAKLGDPAASATEHRIRARSKSASLAGLPNAETPARAGRPAAEPLIEGAP